MYTVCLCSISCTLFTCQEYNWYAEERRKGYFNTPISQRTLLCAPFHFTFCPLLACPRLSSSCLSVSERTNLICSFLRRPTRKSVSFTHCFLSSLSFPTYLASVFLVHLPFVIHFVIFLWSVFLVFAFRTPLSLPPTVTCVSLVLFFSPFSLSPSPPPPLSSLRCI